MTTTKRRLNRMATTVAMALTLAGCRTVTDTYDHHHAHQTEADTMAVQASVDRRIRQTEAAWQEQLLQTLAEHRREQEEQRRQTEREVETVTEWTDSLGRTVRQQQRTTERTVDEALRRRTTDLEQTLRRDMEAGLRTLDSLWQQRYDSLSASRRERDTTATAANHTSGPATGQDSRPWYRRLGDALAHVALGIAIAAAALAAWWLRRKLRVKS